MCGIIGIWTDAPGAVDLEAAGVAMASALVTRGPDSSGLWLDHAKGIALGHRRLAIIDLSPSGHQPMVSASGRYIVVFNGEIYNYGAIRQELRNRYPFRGNSDTEVLLAAVETWGLDAAVRSFNGMFAFALWDQQRNELVLARDRIGIKPLYYGWVGDALLFASELKAFRAFPGFSATIDRSSVALLLRHNCIPSPYSIYEGVFKLPPGTMVRVQAPSQNSIEPVPFWSPSAAVEQAVSNRFVGACEEAVDALDELLRDAVGLQMVADVPLGAFLSGGIDSSLVVALMQTQSTSAVKTFSIGSTDRGYDESHFGAAVARHLGTEHHELVVGPAEALEVVPKIPTIVDEPFADSSLIPTYLVSALARRHVTVTLSGDGGDELFAGYSRHLWGGTIVECDALGADGHSA